MKTEVLDEQRLAHRVLAHSPDNISVVGPDHRYRYVNAHYTVDYGLSPEVIVGKHVVELIGQSAYDKHARRLLERCFAGESVSYHDWLGVDPARRKYKRVSYTPLRDDEGNVDAVLVMSRNLTDIWVASRLMMVGELAGGVSHEFNNLLMVLLNGVEELRLDQDPSQEGLLDDMERAARRAAKITGQLLAFGRRQFLAPTRFDLGQLLPEVARFFEGILPETIRLQMELPRDPVVVDVDERQLQEVLTNLVLNARDAVGGAGGNITLRVATERLDETATLRAMTPGAYARIEVEDDGPGIAPEVLPRVFDPFFTTQEEGTGMGLAMVYGIVSQSGGAVAVESPPGRGATFTVWLPQAEGMPTPAPRHSSSPVRSARILVVEDDMSVRRAVVRTLRRYGYDVVDAAGADEAETLANERWPDAVLTDVVMPGRDGPSLVSQLRRRQSDLPVLFMSGYARDRLGDWTFDARTRFMSKPFTGEEVACELRDLGIKPDDEDQ